jgi:electron transport complex protein RnfC
MIFDNKSKLYFKEKGGFKVDISMKMSAVDEAFKEVPPADKMIVFLRQHIGAETRLLIKEGDSVSYGQKIGDDESGGLLIVPVHSPVDGIIGKISKMLHPISKKEESVVIINTKTENKAPYYTPLDPKQSSREDLLKRTREAGIIGLGGAAFPTHAKLSSNNISTLIINAKESDPNVACDIRLIIEEPKEVLNGIKLMAKILGVRKIIFATRTREGEIAEFENVLKNNSIEIARIRPNYSVGSERLLVKEIFNKEVSSQKYPPDIGVVVHNVATAYAVSKAILGGEPLVSRGLTFFSKDTGAQNLWVRMGTPIHHILRHVGVSPDAFERIALGSLMMGPTIPNSSFPILKATSGITAFTKNEINPYENSLPCIRCAYCNTVCPVNIYPQLIMEAEKRGDANRLRKLHVDICIECGLCSYVCPSRINFTNYLTGGKKRIRNNNK